jgi:hypothetical protein
VLAFRERGTAMRRFLDGAIEASRRLLEA